jgi:tetratricopeptide (TPR) repeat protein
LSRSFRQQLIADLQPTERTTTGTWENWSIKDELAHVIAWQLNSLARLAALIHAETVPDFSETEKINRAIYDTNRDRTLADIVAEGDRAHADFVALIQAMTEDDLIEPARFSDQERRSLAAQIMGNGYEHPIVHYAEYYRRRGDLARATQLHEASVAAVADWPEWYGTARYNLACFYALSGQKEKALHELREALQLQPDLIEWSKQDADLVSLHGDPAYQALYP